MKSSRSICPYFNSHRFDLKYQNFLQNKIDFLKIFSKWKLPNRNYGDLDAHHWPNGRLSHAKLGPRIPHLRKHTLTAQSISWNWFLTSTHVEFEWFIKILSTNYSLFVHGGSGNPGKIRIGCGMSKKLLYIISLETFGSKNFQPNLDTFLNLVLL